jgi:hypothetical protein
MRTARAIVIAHRSRLPVATTAGVDRNGNGENNDLPDRAFQFDGVGTRRRTSARARRGTAGAAPGARR